MVNKLVEIVNENKEVSNKLEDFKRSINGTVGIYEVLKITLDAYIDNHPAPTIYKQNILHDFFKDTTEAYNLLRQQYKYHEVE